MKFTPQKFIAATVATTITCWLLTFFVKPHPEQVEFVSPRHELPNYTAQYPGDTKLSDRIVKSYDLALILVQTPYMQKNFNALECVRRWARENFAEHPDFLHPAVLPIATTNHDTIFGAFGYNLFSVFHDYANHLASLAVKSRVESFHQSDAYQSFRSAFFDFFGWDAEAANLLARYQNDRAKIGADVLLWAAAWVAAGIAGIAYIYRNRKTAYFDALRKVTATTWALLATAYFIQMWQTEKASSLVSMLFSAATAAYLFFPFAIIRHKDIPARIARIRFTPNLTSLASWLTISFLAIQVLTWIRHSAPGATDPVTMLIGSISGNFIHDPARSKRLITFATAAFWLAFSFWTSRQRTKTYEPEADIESRFEELDAVAPLAGIR